MDYTELEQFRYSPTNNDSLPQTGAKLNRNIDRVISWLPNGVLNGGEIQHIINTWVSHDECNFHFNGVHFHVDSTASLNIGMAPGEFYLYYDATTLTLAKVSSLSEAQSKGAVAARCFVDGTNITAIWDIREVIPTMPQDIAELKNRSSGEYYQEYGSAVQWNVNHNLDSQAISSVTCYDDGSPVHIIIPNYIEMTDKDNILIDWGGYPRAGSIKVER